MVTNIIWIDTLNAADWSFDGRYFAIVNSAGKVVVFQFEGSLDSALIFIVADYNRDAIIRSVTWSPD